MGKVNSLPVAQVNTNGEDDRLIALLKEKGLSQYLSTRNGFTYLDTEGTSLGAMCDSSTKGEKYTLYSNGICILTVHVDTNRSLTREYEPGIINRIDNVITPYYTYHLQLETKEDSQQYQNAQRLRPSKLNENEVARGKHGRITVTNVDIPAADIEDEGKWVLSFDKGSRALDEAWGKLVPLVKAGHIHKIKATPIRNDEVSTQALMIYTKSNFAQVCEIRNRIEELGLGLDISLKYIDAVSNRMHTAGICRFDSRDAYLMKVLHGLTIHTYELNGGGTTINNKTYSATAGSLVKKINSYFAACLRLPPLDESQSHSEHKRLQQTLMHQITLALDGKNKVTKGWRFFCFSGKAGAREESTAQLYDELLKLHAAELGTEHSGRELLNR